MLIELEVSSAGDGLVLDKLHQPGNSSVPYDEIYFSLDRKRVLAQVFDRPDGEAFAVAFYLHCFDEGKPLQTPFGIIPLPKPTWERPDHLVSRRYVYYD